MQVVSSDGRGLRDARRPLGTGCQHNPAIHGLRGMAAAMVFTLHLYGALITGGLVDPAVVPSPLKSLAAVGHRGVELFFLISGWLIAGSLARHRSAGHFLLRRLLRIYPAFLVPHVVIFAAGPWIGYAWMAELDPLGWLGHFVSNLLLLPGLLKLPIANIVTWTLSLEMAFYLLAAGAWVIGQQRERWRKAAGVTGWLAVAAVVVYRHRRTAFFAVGVLVWWMQRRRADLAEGLRRIPGLDMVGLAGLCLLFERAFAVSLVFGLAALVAIAGNRGVVCRLLGTRLFQYLGEISYSFYLWHTLVLFGLKRVVAPAVGLSAGHPGWIALFAAMAVAGSVLAGDLSYRWMERRFMPVGHGEVRAEGWALCTHGQQR